MELLVILKVEHLVEACVLTPLVAHAQQADNGAIRAALWLAPPLGSSRGSQNREGCGEKSSSQERQLQKSAKSVFPEQPIWGPRHDWIYRRAGH